MNKTILAHLPTTLHLEQMLGPEKWKIAQDVAQQPWFNLDEFDTRGAMLATDFHRKITKADPDSLLIVSIGRAHLGQLYRAMVYKGYQPHFILSGNEGPEYQLLAQTLLKYHLEPAEDAVPAVLIGDTHGKEYRVPLPTEITLGYHGVAAVHFLMEQLLTEEDGRMIVCPLQQGMKLNIACSSQRLFGNPTYMKVLDKLEGYAKTGINTTSDFLVGHTERDLALDSIRIYD